MPIDFDINLFMLFIGHDLLLCPASLQTLQRLFFSGLEAHLQFVTGAFARDDGLSTLEKEQVNTTFSLLFSREPSRLNTVRKLFICHVSRGDLQ